MNFPINGLCISILYSCKIFICFLMILKDEKPSTSSQCKKQISPKKRSPWRNEGNKMRICKKIGDGQPKNGFNRKVLIEPIRKITLKKTSRLKKLSKHRRKSLLQKLKNKNWNNGTLEEGEIRSDIDITLDNISTDTIENVENDEEDCVVIEPTLEEITIDGNGDDYSIGSTSGFSSAYQTLINSFKQCETSTPYQRKKSPILMDADYSNKRNDVDQPKEDLVLPFFIDVRRGTETINSTDNFMDSTKFSILKEKSQINTSGTVRVKSFSGGNEIIDLGDISSDNTLEGKSSDLEDDSVIFIGETNKNDFIPFICDSTAPNRIPKRNSTPPITPMNKIRTNLFTNSEIKKLNEYNENAYNPCPTNELGSAKRIVIIDGSNVAFKHGLDQEFSVKGLKIAIDYFEKMGHDVKAVIPQFRMNKTKSTNPDELERLHKAGKIVQTPCKNLPGYTSISYDDRFILQLAFEMDAAIVSNDNYRDLLHENPAFKKIIENRVIGYTWCNDIFILPKDPYGKWGPTLHTILNRR